MLNHLRRLHSHNNGNCIASRCSKQGVTLDLQDSGCVCVDCDSCAAFGPNDPKPDYIGLQDSGQPRWFVVEMKRSVRDLRQPVRQLQAGADKIQADPLFNVDDSPQTIIGIIVHGKGKTKTADISSYSIRFRGKPFPVTATRSGGAL